MSDDSNLERELAAFGRTLGQATGEPIRRDAEGDTDRSRRIPRRWWAIGGAAAAGVLAVAGLIAVANRGSDERVEPTSPVTTPGVLSPTTTDAVDLGELPAALEPVPDDPLGLEADGWRLVQRDEQPFDFPADTGCAGTDALVELNGTASVIDILQPPTGTGLDIDVNIIDVGSLDIGNAVASALVAFGDCVAAEIGTEPEIGAMSSVRASWFRAGPEFAIVTIVGEGPRTIVIEIENAPFGDDLIADLVQRSAAYLAPSADDVAPTTTMLLPLVPEDATLPVPDDPLGLEADGWTIVESKQEFLSPSFIPGCTGDRAPAVSLASRRDQPVPPEGSGWDIHVVFVPSAGYDVDEITSCYASYLGVGPGIERVSSSGSDAGWRRIDLDIALAYAVGRDGFGVLMEIKRVGDSVEDELAVDLVERAVRFLSGRPTAVERRPLVEFDGDPYDFACDATGPGLNSTIDYAPEVGPDEPLGRQPRDAFLDAFEQAVASAGRPPVAEGWTEWFADGDSYFVLEVEGQQAGLITVAGWPDAGVWRFNSIELCEAAFGADLDR